MTPNFAHIYEKHEQKSLTQLKRKRTYIKKKLRDLDPNELIRDKKTMYEVTLDIVNELIEKKSSK